jgi:hypothetical protein
MDRVIERRSEIYDHFQASQACQDFLLDPANSPKYLAYYVSMYLLQDSSESLWLHRQRAFTNPPPIPPPRQDQLASQSYACPPRLT